MAQNELILDRRLKRRYRASRRFKFYGMIAIAICLAFLAWFFVDLIAKGASSFRQAQVLAEIHFTQAVADGNYRQAVDKKLRKIISRGWLRTLPLELQKHPEKIGTSETRWVVAAFRVDQYLKGAPAHGLKKKEQKIVDELVREGKAKVSFNWLFFVNGDSKLPELAGIGAALVGSIYVIFITMILALPIGVMTAVYLEEFAPDNAITHLIDININNLAAIPSILFGLLGLAIFINFMGVPRSSALAGGLTLALMTLPVIIIATRASLRTVPNSIREAALGVGASRLQMVWHHVLPLALPGILTGSIIGLARALGETAPLLIVGMMAYIPEAPSSITQAATVLPAQIYTWASESIRAFGERTAAGVLVLLAVMLLLNAVAVWMRRRSEKTW